MLYALILNTNVICSAVAGSDFSVLEPYIIFPAFDTEENDTVCSSIHILDDNQFEGDDQRFNVTIGAILPPHLTSDGSMAVVRIEDDSSDG